MDFRAATLLQAALEHAGRGWPVFPCAQDKSPLTTHGLKDAATDPQKVKYWWRHHPNALIGVPTGAASGFFVIDLDSPAHGGANGLVAWDKLCAGREVPSTRRHDTANGGVHLLWRYDPMRPITNKRGGLPPGVDVRGNGGYIIVPPSELADGRRWSIPDNCEAEQPLEAPSWLYELIANKQMDGSLCQNNGAATLDSYVQAALDAEFGSVARASRGSRNDTLNRAAFNLGQLVGAGRLAEDEVSDRLFGAAYACGLVKDDGAPSVKMTIGSGLDAGKMKPRLAKPPAPEPSGIKRISNDKTAGPSPGMKDVPEESVGFEDFRAYMPQHVYMFMPARELWPAASVNARIPPVALLDADGKPIVTKHGAPKTMPASEWLDRHRPVEQMTWAPGEPEIIEGRLVGDGGWIERQGVHCLNLYRPPTIVLGDHTRARPWLDHVRKIYGEDAEHIIMWLAQRVQAPHVKINHALVLGGAQGIGKDSLLDPIKVAVGPWNFAEMSPSALLGRFNGFLKSVVLRVSEARDLGEVDRYSFYEHTKAFIAAPPDVLRVDEKNLREYTIFNVTGLVITTNHKISGIYLPADDRRHFVAWSNLTKDDFEEGYWNQLWRWYQAGGRADVAAYLANLDIRDFDPKAPPPKTAAWWEIVQSSSAPEDAELLDALDKLGNPIVVTVADVVSEATTAFGDFLTDRRNSRQIAHRFEACGYTPLRNPHAQSGLWQINGRRQVIYGQKQKSPRELHQAAHERWGV